MARISFPLVIDRLEAHYGRPKPPKLTDPWLLILWENVAYLADDERRAKAFRTLRKEVGVKPEEILAASDESLLKVTSHGIMAERFAQKLRQCARICLEEFDRDLNPVLKWPLVKAKKALQKFPGIGEPGAEKILLHARKEPILALDSNGLRVLLRLGFGREDKNYAKTYRAVQAAVAAESHADGPALIRAHQLLRQHGQELCKNNKPKCDQCPLAAECLYRQAALAR